MQYFKARDTLFWNLHFMFRGPVRPFAWLHFARLGSYQKTLVLVGGGFFLTGAQAFVKIISRLHNSSSL